MGCLVGPIWDTCGVECVEDAMGAGVLDVVYYAGQRR
jgi:hypothetical protein